MKKNASEHQVFEVAGFQKRVSDLRDGLSRAAFADKAGVSAETIKAWETKKSLPKGESLVSISDSLNINIQWLLTGYGPKYIEGGAPGADAMSDDGDYAAQSNQKKPDPADKSHPERTPRHPLDTPHRVVLARKGEAPVASSRAIFSEAGLSHMESMTIQALQDFLTAIDQAADEDLALVESAIGLLARKIADLKQDPAAQLAEALIPRLEKILTLLYKLHPKPAPDTEAPEK